MKEIEEKNENFNLHSEQPEGKEGEIDPNDLNDQEEMEEIDLNELENYTDDQLAELFLQINHDIGMTEEGELTFPENLPDYVNALLNILNEREILAPLAEQLLMAKMAGEMDEEEMEELMAGENGMDENEDEKIGTNYSETKKLPTKMPPSKQPK